MLPTLHVECFRKALWRDDERCGDCQGCRNYNVVLAHATAYQKEADKLSGKLKRFSTSNNLERQNGIRAGITRAFRNRDAVLGLLPKEAREKDEEATK